MLNMNEAVETFLLALKGAGRAPKSLLWYRAILCRFAERAGELSPLAITAYLATRQDEVAPSTVAGEYRALRRFINWCLTQELLTVNPLAKVEAPREPETVPRIATAETALLLVAAADSGRWPQRDRALVMALADSGARVSELLSMTTQNLHVIHKADGDHGEVLLIGKGRRRRRLLFGRVAMREVQAWIAARPPEAGTWIWWGERGSPLTRYGVRLLLDRLSHRAGLPEVINPHAFRHGCAIDNLVNGADVRTVQLILGHRNVATTIRYLHLADQVVADAHDKLSDRRWEKAKGEN
jgi:site-specific recombinase XerD